MWLCLTVERTKVSKGNWRRGFRLFERPWWQHCKLLIENLTNVILQVLFSRIVCAQFHLRWSRVIQCLSSADLSCFMCESACCVLPLLFTCSWEDKSNENKGVRKAYLVIWQHKTWRIGYWKARWWYCWSAGLERSPQKVWVGRFFTFGALVWFATQMKGGWWYW